MDLSIGRSLDRISNLPDSILSHILSFVSTKYAVGTSILSTRWRYLWASVPNLNFDDNEYFDNSQWILSFNDDVDSSFMNFVDRVLLLSDVSCFQSFRLVCSAVDDFIRVDTWICAVIKRNARKVELRYMLDDITFKLPSMVFTSTTLVTLILGGRIFLKVPPSVWLPSLKILQLVDIKCENDDSLPLLLNGCPVLEELLFERYSFNDQQVIDVSAPTLRRLKIHCDDTLTVYDDDPDVGYKLLINAPKLEHLDVMDNVSDTFCVMDLSSLLSASIDAGGHTYKIFTGITNVKLLQIFNSTLFFRTCDFALPTFHNLTRLELDACVCGWDSLAEFLECSPNLEVLILLKEDSSFESGNCWSAPRRVPDCLILHLKEVKVNGFSGTEHDLKVVEYLLKNAKVLKKMIVDCTSLDSRGRCHAFMKLTGFSRGSSSCQLDVRSPG